MAKKFEHPRGVRDRMLILKAMKNQGPIGATQIRSRISEIINNKNNKPLTLTSIHTQLNELIRAGKVERTINNKYRLTDQVILTDPIPLPALQQCLTEFRGLTGLVKPDLLKTAKGKRIMEYMNETLRILSQVNNETAQVISEMNKS